MGCFNIACGVSGATIDEGDRMGVLLMKKNTVDENNIFSDVSQADQYLMPSNVYTPVAPPLYGEYDDYGGLSEVESSPVVRYVEGNYGMPVDLFFECLRVQSPFLLSGEGLDFFYGSDCDSAQYVLANSGENLSGVDFVRLGWEWSGEKSEWVFEDTRCRRFFAVDVPDGSGIMELRIWTEGRRDSADVKMFFARTLKDFVERFSSVSGSWLGMDSDRSHSFEMTRGITWMPFIPEAFQKLRGVVEAESMFDHYMSGFDDMVNALPAKLKSVKFDFEVIPFANNFWLQDKIGQMSAEAYRSVLSFPAEWRVLVCFFHVMRSVNRIYLPTNTIKQGADHDAELALGRFLVERAERKVREIDEW